jgi:hypothetical protein
MKFTGCFALLLIAACSPAPMGPPDSGVEPPHILWSADAQSLENPFPDVRLLTATGAAFRADYYRPFILQKALTPKMKAFFGAHAGWATTDVHGFGNFNPTLFRTSAAVNPATLAGSVSRLRKTATGYEVLEADVSIEHSTDVLKGTGLEATDGGAPDDGKFPEFFFVRPGVALPEGDEGLVVVKKGVKTTTGELLGRGAAWDKDASRPDTKAIATALGIAEADVLIALPIKATPVTATYKALSDWVETPAGLAAVTIPAHGVELLNGHHRPVGTWTPADLDWSASVVLESLQRQSYGKPPSSVARVVFGDLAARDLRMDGVWNPAWVADPSQAPVVPLHFVVAIPTGTKPAGGWPTVIGAHGLGGRNLPDDNDNNSYCLENEQLLATKGIACIGIDAPSHGQRGNFIDFFAVEKPIVIRDNFREMTFDLMQLARAAATIDVDGDAQPDLSPDLGYLGNSLGGIMGSAFVPVAAHIKYAVLNVPGGGLSNILVSDDIRDRVGLLIVSKTDGAFATYEYYSQFHIFRAVAQPFLEDADPVNLARALPAGRAVLVQEALGDITIPNFTTENLKGSMKLDAPMANITGTTPLQVISHEDPAKCAVASMPGYNPHGMFGDCAFVRTQAMKFLETKGTEYQVP